MSTKLRLDSMLTRAQQQPLFAPRVNVCPQPPLIARPTPSRGIKPQIQQPLTNIDGFHAPVI